MRFDLVIPVHYSDEDIDYFGRVASALEARGCSVALIVLTRKGQRALGARHRNVFYLYEGFRQPRQPDPAQVADIEALYGCNLSDLVHPEFEYWRTPKPKLIARAVHVFRFLEDFTSRHSCGLFLDNIGGEVIRRVMACLARRGGPPKLIFDFAPFHGRIALTTNEYSWDELPSELPKLSPTEEQFVEQLIAGVRERRKPFGVTSWLLRGGWLARSTKNLYQQLVEEDQHDIHPGFLYYERLQWFARRAVCSHFYEPRVPGEEFLFYPLHIPADTAVTIRAPQFAHQEYLLEYLANRALPSGMKLYVKPHPAGIDRFSIPMLATIRRLPNVRLLEPRINSHELIADARGVVVINSTVGFESLFYEKPVVVLGNVFYRGRGVTTDVENLALLRDHVRHALDHPPDPMLIRRFIHACYRATSPGTFMACTDENAAQVVEAVIAKARRLGVPLGAPAAAPSREARSA